MLLYIYNIMLVWGIIATYMKMLLDIYMWVLSIEEKKITSYWWLQMAPTATFPKKKNGAENKAEPFKKRHYGSNECIHMHASF